jgi:alpha-beta hydrolase superfamily lysophospholipase
MKHPTPAAPALAVRDGLAYALWVPDEPPAAGVVILHGAGSAKENHFDFARVALAHGLAALAFDARGHGESEGPFGPRALEDVRAMCDVILDHAPAVALRGSSMGGFLAVHAGARDPRVGAVAAICPAPEDLLLRSLRAGRLDFPVNRDPVEMWLETLSLRDAATALAPRTALLLMHAEGDEQVPAAVSEELYLLAGRPKRLLLLPGGHHRSLQHDGEVQAESVRWILRSVAAA